MTIEDVATTCAERGAIPDALLRFGMRRLLRATLRRERAGGAGGMLERRAGTLRQMQASPVAMEPEAANRQHYELPPEYFRLVLGPRLKYSCGLWSGNAATLAESETAMLALTAARAGIAPGQRVLELGCGWGSLTLWMAERYPDLRVTAVSNSHAQRRFIEEQLAARGLVNVCVETADVNTYAPRETFDRIVSVEMFEHLCNWNAMFERLSSWLAPGGEVFIHVFCHRDLCYRFETDGRSDWMARHFFTGGLMPAEDLFRDTCSPLRVARQWRVNGRHYALTSRAWLARHDAHRGTILPLFGAVYGPEAGAWFHRWRIFYLACAELFAYDAGRQWHVTHVRLERGARP